MKQPDRFERMVNNQYGVECVTGNEFWVSREVAAELLRKEHAWMRRMVQGLRAVCAAGHYTTPHSRQCHGPCDGYQMACEDILRTLDQRRK